MDQGAKFFWFMNKGNPLEPLIFYSEIEKTTRRNQREVRQSRQYQQSLIDDQEQKDITVEMDNNPVNQQPLVALAPQTMYDYSKPTLIGVESSILRPTIVANNFEINLNIIQMVQ
ncbi:transcription factor bHLH112-like protein [Gossypium australe]|uniref:Transcription factor bHLH112-like protein n=1 Tax=Gossypium australe TaxID=47621 RepID=A0A5B6UXE3_9ROSI|nr:transcription factor bHLH112-like protein [Gossypium australe]